MLCCFSRSCFIQTENNISYDNKQNKYMTISNAPSQAVSHVSPCALNVKAWEFNDCLPEDIAVFSDPFPLTLRSSWERSTEGMGPGGWWTLCWFGICMFSACCTSCKKKNWNVLVVYSCYPSATVAKSSNMYFNFLCAMFFPVFLLCFLSFFLFISTQHQMVVGDCLWQVFFFDWSTYALSYGW